MTPKPLMITPEKIGKIYEIIESTPWSRKEAFISVFETLIGEPIVPQPEPILEVKHGDVWQCRDGDIFTLLRSHRERPDFYVVWLEMNSDKTPVCDAKHTKDYLTRFIRTVGAAKIGTVNFEINHLFS